MHGVRTFRTVSRRRLAERDRRMIGARMLTDRHYSSANAESVCQRPGANRPQRDASARTGEPNSCHER